MVNAVLCEPVSRLIPCKPGKMQGISLSFSASTFRFHPKTAVSRGFHSISVNRQQGNVLLLTGNIRCVSRRWHVWETLEGKQCVGVERGTLSPCLGSTDDKGCRTIRRIGKPSRKDLHADERPAPRTGI